MKTLKWDRNLDMLNKIAKIVLIVNLVVLDGLVGYLLYKFEILNPKLETISNSQNTNTKIEYVDKCGEECMAAIAARVEELKSGRVEVIPTVRPTTKPMAKQKTRSEQVLTIPGEGSTSNMSWTDITATNFYFDTKDYPGLTEVYFEAKMKLINGNGYGYVRLYDVTNGIAINGSENNTNSQTEVWTKSQKVYFWAGKNLIRVQAKSLTADTVVYTQGRLRIVTEN